MDWNNVKSCKATDEGCEVELFDGTLGATKRSLLKPPIKYKGFSLDPSPTDTAAYGPQMVKRYRAPLRRKVIISEHFVVTDQLLDESEIGVWITSQQGKELTQHYWNSYASFTKPGVQLKVTLQPTTQNPKNTMWKVDAKAGPGNSPPAVEIHGMMLE